MAANPESIAEDSTADSAAIDGAAPDNGDVLSQAEVGALLEGVADGVVPTGQGLRARGTVTTFQIKSSHSVSSYCPASLVNVYARLARRMQAALQDVLRKDVAVTLEHIRRHRYDEYVATLESPVCIHCVAARQLPGTGLVVFDAALIDSFVNHYFGGGPGGDAEPSAEHTLSPAEMRMSHMLLRMLLTRMAEAWSEVDQLEFLAQGVETDPRMVTIAASPESMLVARLRVELAGQPGELQIAMPLSMLAPVRAKLEASGQGSLRVRERFLLGMREQLKASRVALAGTLCEVPLTLREVLAMAPGDVIPVDLPKQLALHVGKTPVLSGTFGVSRGMNAISATGPAGTDADQE